MVENGNNRLNRKYYNAYDDRYRQIHQQGLQWFEDCPSPIVCETMQEFSISTQHSILEIGCGEGRDAFFLLDRDYQLLATDVAPEAIAFCQRKRPAYAHHFQILDCVTDRRTERFDFIYAVAVAHMLILDEDRDAFYRFIANHLNTDGVALICTMGDGTTERRSDIRTAFDQQERIHEQSGKKVRIAGTSCRMVSFQTFDEELQRSGMMTVKKGMTSIEPVFPQMMYAVVKAV